MGCLAWRRSSERSRRVGWTEGRNLQIDYRWTGADANRIRADVVEAVAAAPDLIVADGATIVRALQQATAPCLSYS